MSFRSRRSRLSRLPKVDDTAAQTVKDVVAQVMRDVATNEAEDADTTHSTSLGHSADHTAMTQQNAATAATETNDFGSSRRQSLTPPPGQLLDTDPQCLRTSQRWSFRGQRNDDQSNNDVAMGGLEGQEMVLGSNGNPWADDIPMTKPMQSPAVEGSDRRNTDGRQSHTPPPNLVQENDGEPALNGVSLARHSGASQWSKGIDSVEMEEVENDGEPAHGRLPLAQLSKPSKWSGDIEFDDMEEVEMRDSRGKRGRKGGPILPRHVWSLRPGVRFVVPFNSLDQPVRKGGHVLLRFLGDIARNAELCPVGEVNWPRVDKSYKAKIVALVREKFVLPDRPEIDKCILKHIGNRWKSHRHDLKTQYKTPDKTQEQVASVVPRGISPSQWVKLVQYWFSEKSKVLSDKGKEARAAQSRLHTTGSKSFARKRDEFEKAHGREPGALEWFVETHKRKDGTFVENSSKEFADAAAKIARHGSTFSSSQRTVGENQAFNGLMYSDDERLYQRPIGHGFGVDGNKVFGHGAKLKKREYLASGASAEVGSSKKKLFRVGEERRKSGFFAPDSSAEVERLNFAMTAMSETNELMQAQITMQSQQLQMQSQQLQMQSKQIEGLQQQLQQVTSLLTKFGVMLNNQQCNFNNEQSNLKPREVHFQGISGTNRQVSGASSEYSDGESDSTDWD